MKRFQKGFHKKIRRGFCIGLALVLTASLGACGKKNSGDGSSGGGKKGSAENMALAKEHVFRAEEIDLSALQKDVDNSNFDTIVKLDDMIYMIMRVFNDQGNMPVMKLLSMKTDGSGLASIELQVPVQDSTAQEETAETELPVEGDPGMMDGYEYTGFSNFQVTKQGRIYGVKEHNKEYYADPDNYVSLNEKSVCCWDMEGKLLWESRIEEPGQEDGAWYYVESLTALQDGSLIVGIAGGKTGRITVDPQGKMSKMQTVSANNDIMDRLVTRSTLPDGSTMVLYYDENWADMYAAKYDMEKGTLTDETKLPAKIAYSGLGNAVADDKGDFWYSVMQGIYKYHIGDEEPTLMMNFINSDFVEYFSRIQPLNDESFIGLYSVYNDDSRTNSTHCAIFTHVPPEDIPDKMVLTLAGQYVPTDLSRRVVEYNKTNDEYRIVVKNYSEYNTTEDYNAGATQLNMDIVSGKMPDILVVDEYNMPLENFAGKGLLADIGRLIEKDEELSKLVYMENVFEACKIGGKLYEIVPAYSVGTYIGKRSLVGDRTNWTMDEAMQTLASLPDGTSLFGADFRREYFFNTAMSYCGRDYIDVSTGKCSFDSDEFVSLMEYAKSLPTANDGGMAIDDGAYVDYQSQFRENKTLLGSCYISNFQDLVEMLNGTFGEPVSFIGFPNASGTGSVIYCNSTYAISAKSKNQDAAWNFLRYYLTPEYQKTLEWQLPVLREQFDVIAKKGMEKRSYTDADGNTVEYDYTFWMNGEEFVLDPLTQEQVDQITEFLLSVKSRNYYNQDIQNIITEEIEAFFQGQKSAKEVAGIIQSRAQIFVNENR